MISDLKGLATLFLALILAHLQYALPAFAGLNCVFTEMEHACNKITLFVTKS